ncbi:uncharacterized protein LOC119689917 [Teleopsis dalmanni]|uniref:uncharacterized protein LOC119689917 n=1 Tax=Teleopsis dalmanni TaxID=139649 RepID=UPI0018CFDFF1|nr:uncharacterized protein LOC119689917 [Teleopsis dalmanni]
MRTRSLVLVLGVFLLVQVIVAKPSKDSSSSESDEENSLEDVRKQIKDFLEKRLEEKDQLTKRNKLFIEIISDFGVFTKFVVREGLKIFKKLLKEPFLEILNTDAINERKADFIDFVQKAEEMKTIKQTIDNFNIMQFALRYIEIVDTYNITKVTNPTEEVVIFSLALQKNGLTKFKDDGAKEYEKFEKHLFKRLDDFVNSLSSEEKENEEKLINWIKEYKETPEGVQRTEMFVKFIAFYDDATQKEIIE